jgi:hypothetical protein
MEIATPPRRADEIIDALADAQRTLLDPRDIPNSWTPRQCDTYEARRRLLTTLPSLIQSAQHDIGQVEEQLAPLRSVYDRLTAAESQLDGDEASRTALRRGVASTFDHVPMLPPPLRTLLTDTCESCGHADVTWWPGGLDDLTRRVQDREQRLSFLRDGLVFHLQRAEELLAC